MGAGSWLVSKGTGEASTSRNLGWGSGFGKFGGFCGAVVFSVSQLLGPVLRASVLQGLNGALAFARLPSSHVTLMLLVQGCP